MNCKYCERPRKLPDGKACAPCRTAQKTSRNKYKDNRKKAGLCWYCGENKPRLGCAKCESCISKVRTKSIRHIARLIEQTFLAYGGPQCACCGETILKFLTLDHTDGGGCKHRRELGDGIEIPGGVNLYRILRRQGFPVGYQVLCFNCNCGRSQNGGVCPHRTIGNTSSVAADS